MQGASTCAEKVKGQREQSPHTGAPHHEGQQAEACECVGYQNAAPERNAGEHCRCQEVHGVYSNDSYGNGDQDAERYWQRPYPLEHGEVMLAGQPGACEGGVRDRAPDGQRDEDDRGYQASYEADVEREK